MNKGFSVFNQRIDSDFVTPNVTVSQSDYDHWRNKIFTFEGIRGIRYGQSFCNHFGITDHILYYRDDWQQADEHIRKFYIEG
jgi:hypothetical protein